MQRRLTPLGGILALGLIVGATAPPAGAATFATGLAGYGTKLDVASMSACGASGGLSTNVGSFSASGPAGSGEASCGDHSSAQVKKPTTPHPFGRFDREGLGWLDSNDLTHVDWTVDIGAQVRSVSFLLTDAHDQPNSHFRIDAEGSSWALAQRQANGGMHHLTILFDTPTLAPVISFHSGHNDGWGISEVTVQPVPVPGALVAALTGVGLLGAAGLRRRRRAA